MGTTQQGQGRVIAVFLGLVLVALATTPILLHFTQKRHNQLHVAFLAPRPQESPPPASGEVFAGTVAAIIEHELSGGSGWRPNDFFLWGPGLMADNNANRQLGIIQALRESVRVFKDHLTKVSATEYDPNLVAAETAFRNDAKRFWFPSAESKFREAVDGLRLYIDGLRAEPPRSKPINRRNVELIRLFQVWTDLLGDAHANLFKTKEADGSPVPVWRTDDYYYHAQGFAHVMYYLIQALKREYEVDLINRPSVIEVFDEVTDALGKAARLKPFIVLDGNADGLFANHRRNLDGYIVDARQKMYSIREELEK
jgi:hypothetical protein